MGKTQKIAADMDKANFTEIDYFVSTTIFVSSEDPEILTSHPSDSYTLDKGETSSIIQITNPEKFWSINKFLVVKK